MREGPLPGACPRTQASMWGHFPQPAVWVGRGKGKGLYYCPQASVKSEEEFRAMAVGAARDQLWLGKMVRSKDFGVRQNEA